MSAGPAPGSYRDPIDRWGPLAPRLHRLGAESVVVIDARVSQRHPAVRAELARLPARQRHVVVGGEPAKSFAELERLLARAAPWLPRSGTLVAVGGGTVGDLCTVAAHLLKRGVRLVHVPSTLLAAVDSS